MLIDIRRQTIMSVTTGCIACALPLLAAAPTVADNLLWESRWAAQAEQCRPGAEPPAWQLASQGTVRLDTPCTVTGVTREEGPFSHVLDGEVLAADFRHILHLACEGTGDTYVRLFVDGDDRLNLFWPDGRHVRLPVRCR